MATAERLKYTLEQYLDFENNSQERHEYYRGEIFLMTGGTTRHNEINGNLYYHLRIALESSPCHPHLSTQRLAIAEADLHTYPDVAIVCGPVELHPIDRNAIANPRIVIEVLSPSTERYDRGKKFELYRHLPSLHEYVLVSQNEPHIERFVRQDNGLWTMFEVGGLDGVLELSATKCRIPLSSIYQNVSFVTEPRADISPPVQVRTERLDD
jgi:Uma2 family endonuclease